MFGERIKISLGIVTAVCAISCASILIKVADAPPLTVAFYRVFIAACLYLNFVRLPSGSALISRRSVSLIGFAGVCLAAHFGFWITSLSYTSVASSVSLVNTSPFFVVLFSRFFRNRDASTESRSAWLWVGIALGVIGSAGLAGSDILNPQKHSLLGDVLALLGAMSLAGYLMISKSVGLTTPLPFYLACVYGFAAFILFMTCLVAGSPLVDFSWRTFLMFFLIGIIPQGIGHSLIVWSLRYLPTDLVSLYIIGEPIGATLLAYLFLKECPTLAAIMSMGLILAGILISQIAFYQMKSGKTNGCRECVSPRN